MIGPSGMMFPATLTMASAALLRGAAYLTGACTIVFSVASVLAARRQWLARIRQRSRPDSELPSVTILRPLKGADCGMYDNLASVLSLDYPRYQVLFALQSPDDPSLPILKTLRRNFPDADFEIIISKNRIGYNPKVNNLSNAYPFAKNDLLLISDSDIRLSPEFLREAVAPFEDPAVGMTSCFYRSSSANCIGGLLEAASINTQFLPQALVASQLLDMRFAMGAAMLIRRSAFDAIGGFSALSEHLADDFVLGASIRASGRRLEFSAPLVESYPGSPSIAEQLVHSARWARTIRICQPWGYAGLIVLHGFSLLTLSLALTGWNSRVFALWLLVAAARIASTAWAHFAYLDNPGILPQLPIVPLSDLTQFIAWLSGFRSRTVLWRGEYYQIQVGGRLVPRKQKSRFAVATTT